jgi:hypothetical protein
MTTAHPKPPYGLATDASKGLRERGGREEAIENAIDMPSQGIIASMICFIRTICHN